MRIAALIFIGLSLAGCAAQQIGPGDRIPEAMLATEYQNCVAGEAGVARSPQRCQCVVDKLRNNVSAAEYIDLLGYAGSVKSIHLYFDAHPKMVAWMRQCPASM